jgi:FkbM family methyltransferase
LIIKRLPRDASCVDVGAHHGDILRLMQAQAPRGRFLAFEPLPDCYKTLLAQFPDVEVFPYALGDVATSCPFQWVESKTPVIVACKSADMIARPSR